MKSGETLGIELWPEGMEYFQCIADLAGYPPGQIKGQAERMKRRQPSKNKDVNKLLDGLIANPIGSAYDYLQKQAKLYVWVPVLRAARKQGVKVIPLESSSAYFYSERVRKAVGNLDSKPGVEKDQSKFSRLNEFSEMFGEPFDRLAPKYGYSSGPLRERGMLSRMRKADVVMLGVDHVKAMRHYNAPQLEALGLTQPSQFQFFLIKLTQEKIRAQSLHSQFDRLGRAHFPRRAANRAPRRFRPKPA